MPLSHPPQPVPPGAPRWILFAVLLVLLLVLGARAGGGLRTRGTRGIIALELAGTAPRARAAMDRWKERWGPGAVDRVRGAIYWDFAFIPVYAAWAALACVMSAAVVPGSRGWVAAGMALAWGAWVAGGLDCVENVAMLRMLGPEPSAAAARLSQVCAGLKFALLGACAVYAAAALLLVIVHGLRGPAH
jgi:hypothetical protein